MIEDNKRCEQFNDYFFNIGEKLASEKSEKKFNTNNSTNYIHNNNTNSLFITSNN